MPPQRRPEADRFWEKVDKNGPLSELVGSPCWLWTAGLAAGGYGSFTTAERRGCKAHRWAYTNTVGPVPPGLDLDHLCRVRRCVNPSHLEPVTRRENLLRGAGTPSVTHCPAGHDYAVFGAVGRNGWRRCNECARLRMAAKNAGRPRKVRPPKTHCPHGHEYTPENTYRRPNGTPLCRVCMSWHAKAGKARAKARAAAELA